MEKVIPVMLELLAQRNQVHTILCGPSSVDRMWEGRLPNISVGPMKVGHHNFRRTILPTLVFLRHELRRIRPDVVVTTAPLLVAMLACVRLELRYKVVSWIHDNPPRPRGWAAPDMLLLRLAWGHLTITEGAAADFVNAGLRNVHAISYPLDCNEFTDRSLIPRPAGPAEFVYIGKISRPHKRIDRIVHALQEIEDLDSWHLTIVGDGPDREWLQKALEEGEQASRVTWHKWSSRPWDLVKEASAFLFTSANPAASRIWRRLFHEKNRRWEMSPKAAKGKGVITFGTATRHKPPGSNLL